MKPEQSGSYRQFDELMEWADEARKLGVRTNADQPDQAAKAIAFGAEGIGLCRTEHMFFDRRIDARARDDPGRDDARTARRRWPSCSRIQREDFDGIFRAMKGCPVTIRTLDPPLHEFLPHDAKGQAEIAAGARRQPKRGARQRVEELHEFNPMLGLRGCRLGIVYPEITEMQARAILEAACRRPEGGHRGRAGDHDPAGRLRRRNSSTRRRSSATWPTRCSPRRASKVEYLVGTMIELPRAALAADEIAESGRVLQLRHQRPDADDARHEPRRRRHVPPATTARSEILPDDPFQTLDLDGVGELMQIGVERGRKTRPDLKIGICGEHGGDPDSRQVLPPDRAELRQLLAVPRADRAAGRGAGRHRGARRAAAREVADAGDDGRRPGPP